MDDPLKREVEAFYHAYIDAFRRQDTAALAGMVTSPMARVTPAGPELMPHAPDPVALAARTGWADTVDVQVEVLDASPERAHLRLVHALRVRADGTAIESLRGIYALVRQEGAWRIAAVSSIVTPA